MNYLEMRGIDFIEFATPQIDFMHPIFTDLGFFKVMSHKEKKIALYRQNGINFLVNEEPNSFAANYCAGKTSTICSLGISVKDASAAFTLAQEKGAKPFMQGDYYNEKGNRVPAIYGIGDSLIYFVEGRVDDDLYPVMGFVTPPTPVKVTGKGLIAVDHLSFNVKKGELLKQVSFFKKILGFYEVRSYIFEQGQFDLKTVALRSPCNRFAVIINESDGDSSDINKFIKENKREGIQHLALLSHDITKTMEALRNTEITLSHRQNLLLDIIDEVPNVTETDESIEKYNFCINGDEQGYILQSYTENIIGPISFEFLQRKNHLSFGRCQQP